MTCLLYNHPSAPPSWIEEVLAHNRCRQDKVINKTFFLYFILYNLRIVYSDRVNDCRPGSVSASQAGDRGQDRSPGATHIHLLCSRCYRLSINRFSWKCHRRWYRETKSNKTHTKVYTETTICQWMPSRISKIHATWRQFCRNQFSIRTKGSAIYIYIALRR